MELFKTKQSIVQCLMESLCQWILKGSPCFCQMYRSHVVWGARSVAHVFVQWGFHTTIVREWLLSILNVDNCMCSKLLVEYNMCVNSATKFLVLHADYDANAVAAHTIS